MSRGNTELRNDDPVAAELADLRRELEQLNRAFVRLESECRSQLARFERTMARDIETSDLVRLKDQFVHFKRDVEHSFTHIAGALREYHQAIAALKVRVERYVNLPPLKYVRELRRRVFRLR